jgi:hypothetical protein
MTSRERDVLALRPIETEGALAVAQATMENTAG